MRRVRRKGGNKEKVFGCDLLEHLNASSQEIPLVLRCCSEFVETHGIVDGIYRLSGVSSNIQKLRGEFENDSSPDLNKDLYLQDIHCVSSLCKAYFRELPNPLLTYQLYDKFAEAVAIQLEEERLVKIRDVLKELPRPHYRTLEFLMRHLVRMASYCSETNMHARNLAIVWAPNLLRSKDIEASGFNGTAAFMEVRVQSIVVEFILTHVPQLFPEYGVSTERRKSLPSPSAESNQEEGFFKSIPTQAVPNFGHISPGDGPLPIRPYHAIIEGTDKRKGSLKGRKWMSIFNIGGRFHDPRRRHKQSAKEKDRPVLRPARSMDSLSTPSFPNEGTRRSAQRPPSTHNSTPSPLVTSSPQPGSDVSVSTGAIGGSEYAVTYRRGTGLVSGGAGTQGTYTALDPEGLGLTGNETLQSRSPGLSTKVGRRAAMHITGPTMVTVPLHITSNLALGLLQGGGSDRVIHRSRDKDGGDRVEGKEGGEKVERSESRGKEGKVEESRKVEEEEKNHSGKVTERKGGADAEGNTVAGGGEEEEGEEKKEEEEEEVREECRWKPELAGGRRASREQRAKSLSSNTEEDNDEDAVDDDKDIDEYMDMKGVTAADFKPEATQHVDDRVFDASDILNSTEVEGDDLGLSGYVQDNFEFLDQMDCSAMDHMDCSVSYQVNEFSVEPPGHSDDEYEIMAQAQPSYHSAEVHTHLQPDPELKPHRPLSIDINSRHTKSLSLPYITSPVHGPEESCSEEDLEGDVSDENDYSSEEDESMYVKSLPADFFLSNLPEFEGDSDKQVGYALDGVPAHQLQIPEDRECHSMNLEFPACKVTTTGDEEQVEVKDKEDEDGLEEKEITKTEEEDEVHQRRDELENKRQSKVIEEELSVVEEPRSDKEEPLTSDESTHCCCADDPLPSNDESSAVTDITVEEEEEVVDHPRGGYPPCHAVSCVTHEELKDETEQPRACVREDMNERDSGEGEDRNLYKEIEDTFQEMVLEMTENDENMHEQSTEEGCEVLADIKHEEKMQEGGEEQGICGTSRDIWDEYEEVVCEVIEDEESEQAEREAAKERVAREGDTIEDVKAGEDEEQIAKVSGDEMVEADGGETEDSEEETTEVTEEQIVETEMQQELEEKETNLPKMSEATQGKYAINDEAQHHDGEEVISKDKQNKERDDEQPRTPPSVDLVRLDMKESKEGRKCEESDGSPGGVGRKLVVSKHPKVYQVKAVPVVPPKPQHCKITALTLRQQQQQRDRRDADRERENSAEQEKVFTLDQGSDLDEGRANKEKPTLRGGEKERERRRDGDESATRDASRNSPLSMCFDEAVAIATMRRQRERVREGEGKAEGVGE
ncbi:LOW QUALITY PROTEIN: rho GTPase-activating protein 30 [Pagrus major]|uniref:LOW QUALITY PROTEIN: rho GTPase-activating protein 30 n=1 Tax=Pagrus major TaxID=143350 RepID=UPI003CC8E0BB